MKRIWKIFFNISKKILDLFYDLDDNNNYSNKELEIDFDQSKGNIINNLDEDDGNKIEDKLENNNLNEINGLNFQEDGVENENNNLEISIESHYEYNNNYKKKRNHLQFENELTDFYSELNFSKLKGKNIL